MQGENTKRVTRYHIGWLGNVLAIMNKQHLSYIIIIILVKFMKFEKIG